MKKNILTMAAATAMTLAMSMTAFAGQWKSDANGWWWQKDDGSYPVNTWQWIDGNYDGIAESYYFNDQGYCLMNATTPDGYTVNESGAWTVNGVVQTQQAAGAGQTDKKSQAPAMTKKKDLWKAVPTMINGSRRENIETSKGVTYARGWSLYSTFLGIGAVDYENKDCEYQYLTVTFAPCDFMSQTGLGKFIVRDNDAEERLEEIDFSYDDDPQTITVYIGDTENVRIGVSNEYDDAGVVIPEMYFHN